MVGRKKVKGVIEVAIKSGSLSEVLTELNRIKSELTEKGCTEFEVETSVENEPDRLSGEDFHYVKSTVTGR